MAWTMDSRVAINVEAMVATIEENMVVLSR